MSEDAYIQLCPLFCSQCNQKFNTKIEYYKHNSDVHELKEIHIEKKYYVCPLCQAGFRRRAHVNRHLISQHSNAQSCLPCGEEFPSFDLLMRHLENMHFDANEHTLEDNDVKEIHIERKYHVCQLCKARFQRKEHLRRHISNLHSDVKSCRVCHEIFASLDALLKHVGNVHSDVDERTVENNDLKEIHVERKCHMCQLCKARFQRKEHLRRHISTLHADVKSCMVCNETFASLEALLKHVENVHSDVDEWDNGEIKLYKECQPVTHCCPHCKANFKRRDHMLRHIRCTHLPEKMVSCRMCKKSYKRTDHVVRHLREKHNVTGSNIKSLINTE